MTYTPPLGGATVTSWPPLDTRQPSAAKSKTMPRRTASGTDTRLTDASGTYSTSLSVMWSKAPPVSPPSWTDPMPRASARSPLAKVMWMASSSGRMSDIVEASFVT